MATNHDTDRAQGTMDRLRRPSHPDRQYSAHVYTTTSPRDLEAGLSIPPLAHLPHPDFHDRPLETLVTVRPSLHILGSERTISEASSGLSIKEIDAPEDVLDVARARGPGTYRCNFTDTDDLGLNSSAETVCEKEPGLTKTVTFELEPDSCNDRIATKATLEERVARHPLPEVHTNKHWLSLRYGFFSTYRRLHALVLIGNIIAISVMIARVVRHPGAFTYQSATTAVAANLCMGTLMRHEHCVNLLFRLAIVLPHWLPLSIRRRVAKVYSYGGIHSACGISAFLWYIFFSVLLINQLNTKSAWEEKTLGVLTALILVIFTILIVFAHPTIRQRWHDTWEITHRFGGWAGIALVWTQLLILIIQTPTSSTGILLMKQPAFWFLLTITFCIAYPWIRLRKLKLTAEPLSSHAIRLNFNNRNQETCHGIRLSTSPLTENHGFATIPNANGEKGFSVLVSRAGDWTGDLIQHPPKFLYSRGAPTIGVARVAQLFKSVIIVATGSGIGPCMSWLVANPITPNRPGRLIWSARFPEQTYGKKLMGEVFTADPDAVVIDTKVTGREPELLEVVFAEWKEVGAEAVVIISNPKVTREVVFGLETRGVPAYGAIFDS